MDKETLLTGFKKELGEPAANGYLGDTGVKMRTLDKYVDALLPTITSDDMVDESFFKSQASVSPQHPAPITVNFIFILFPSVYILQ